MVRRIGNAFFARLGQFLIGRWYLMANLSIKNSPSTTELANLYASMVMPGSSEWKATQADRRKKSPVPRELQREFRNAQRSIVRDINATMREYNKSIGTPQADFLAYRLSNLQSLRHAMLGSYKRDDGLRYYNLASGRLDAYDVYLAKFKGRANLDEQRTKIVRAPMSMPKFDKFGNLLKPGQDVFRDNAIKKYGYDKLIDDTPFAQTARYQELMDELEQAIREYDSDQARRIITKLMHGAEAYRTFRKNRQ